MPVLSSVYFPLFVVSGSVVDTSPSVNDGRNGVVVVLINDGGSVIGANVVGFCVDVVSATVVVGGIVIGLYSEK